MIDAANMVGRRFVAIRGTDVHSQAASWAVIDRSYKPDALLVASGLDRTEAVSMAALLEQSGADVPCTVCGAACVLGARYTSSLLGGLAAYRCPNGHGSRLIDELRYRREEQPHVGEA